MFCIVPNEVIADHSLTLIETRVLLALYSYRDPKSSRPVWPGRAALSKRCGYHPDVISRTTTALERKGWIRKIRRGKKRTNAYEIIGKSDLTEYVRSVVRFRAPVADCTPCLSYLIQSGSNQYLSR